MRPVRDIPPYRVLPCDDVTVEQIGKSHTAFVVAMHDLDPPTVRERLPVVRPTEPAR